MGKPSNSYKSNIKHFAVVNVQKDSLLTVVKFHFQTQTERDMGERERERERGREGERGRGRER